MDESKLRELNWMERLLSDKNTTMSEGENNILDEHRTHQYVFQNYNLSSSILEHFNQCRNRNLYTDVRIKVQDQIFHCHKILLDASCPYFKSSFSFSEHKEESNDLIEMGDFSAVAFNELLNYIYTAQLTITADTVVEILQCADFLGFRSIVKSCSGFLLQHINSENCVKAFQMADCYSLHHLAEQAWDFILDNFDTVSQSEDFCEIPYTCLLKILSSDFLKVFLEIDLLAVIDKWISYHSAREKHLQDLIKCVRIEQSTLNSLDHKILSSIEFEKDKKIKPRLNKVIVLVSRDTNPLHPRNSIKSDIIWYNQDYMCWDTLTSFPFDHRQLYGVAVVNNNIYITGGVGNEVPLFDTNKIVYNECWEFNVKLSKWKEIFPMNFARFNHATTGFLNSVFVVGGRGQVGSCLRGDCESYDLETQQWTRLTSIRGVDGVGNSALVPLDGRLFLLGGMYSQKKPNKEVRINNYEEAQYYDPEQDSWHELPALSRHIQNESLRVTGVDCLAVNGFLICIDDNRGKYIKIYNPVTKTFSNLIQCHGYHRFAGSTVIDNKLVCTGGLEVPFQSHDMVHYFDLNKPEEGWSMMPPLRVPMSNHACVTIHKPTE